MSQRITQSYAVSLPKSNRLLESCGRQVKITESDGGFVVKNVPVSHYKVSHNNTLYPKELWQYVKEQGQAEGTLSLADHPPDGEDGSVKDICGVWHNMECLDDVVVADWHLVGSYGRLFAEVLKNGGEIGLSSSAWAELEEREGYSLVKTENFYLERLGDAVLFPAMDTYASKSNLSASVKESRHTNNKKEVFSMSLSDEIVLSNLKNQVSLLCKQVQKTVKSGDARKIADKREELQVILESLPPSLQEIKAGAKSVLEEADTAMTEISGKALGELKQTREQIRKLQTENEALKQSKKRARDLVQALGEKVKEVEGVKSKLTTIQEDIAKKEADISRARRKEKALTAAVNSLQSRADEVKSVKTELDKIKESVAILKRSSATSQKDVYLLLCDKRDQLQVMLKLYQKVLKSLSKKKAKKAQEKKMKTRRRPRVSRRLASRRRLLQRRRRRHEQEDEHYYEDPVVLDEDEDMEMLEADVPDFYEDEDEFMAITPGEAEDYTEMEEMGDIYGDELEEIEEMEEMEEMEPIYESAVRQYYNEIRRKDPSVRRIRRHILNAKSVSRAVSLYERFRGRNREALHRAGSMENEAPSWIPKNGI